MARDQTQEVVELNPDRTRTAIRVTNLWKRYGSTEAVRGINLEIADSKFVVVAAVRHQLEDDYH